MVIKVLVLKYNPKLPPDDENLVEELICDADDCGGGRLDVAIGSHHFLGREDDLLHKVTFPRADGCGYVFSNSRKAAYRALLDYLDGQRAALLLKTRDIVATIATVQDKRNGEI